MSTIHKNDGSHLLIGAIAALVVAIGAGSAGALMRTEKKEEHAKLSSSNVFSVDSEDDQSHLKHMDTVFCDGTMVKGRLSVTKGGGEIIGYSYTCVTDFSPK